MPYDRTPPDPPHFDFQLSSYVLFSSKKSDETRFYFIIFYAMQCQTLFFVCLVYFSLKVYMPELFALESRQHHTFTEL